MVVRHDSRTAAGRGFTLVELLVVIGIIALLIAILMPALQGARAQAQAVACGSNMRQIFMGLRMYADDNHGWIPATVFTYPRSGGTDYIYYNQVLTQYPPTTGGWQAPTSYIASQNVYLCPSQDGATTFRGSYALNGRMTAEDYTQPASAHPYASVHTNSAGTWYHYNLNKTLMPTEMYLLGDVYKDKYYFYNQATDRPDFRHRGKMNILFHDGHVELLAPADLRGETDATYYRYLPFWNRREYKP